MERSYYTYRDPPQVNYIDCPHAEWSIKCPISGEECKTCPVYKARMRPDPPLYVFPRHTNQTVEY